MCNTQKKYCSVPKTNSLKAPKRDIGSFQKRSILPHGGNFCRPEGDRGEKKLFLIIVNVLGHPKGVGGLTSYFLRGGGMDVFWNDPF
jgi:hypothetical protein